MHHPSEDNCRHAVRGCAWMRAERLEQGSITLRSARISNLNRVDIIGNSS